MDHWMNSTMNNFVTAYILLIQLKMYYFKKEEEHKACVRKVDFHAYLLIFVFTIETKALCPNRKE